MNAETMSGELPAAGNRDLGTRRLALLAVTVFVSGASVHYQTPMLARIAAEFGADSAAVGWIPTLTFGGFMAGTMLIAPLGDRMDKRALIVGQLVLLALSCLAMAAAPSLAVAIVASFLIGFGTSVSQSIVPLTAELAHPAERGRALGTILSALFLGILFGRMAGGLVTWLLGWRWMYVIAALLLLTMMSVLLRGLPVTPPKATMSYAALMRSVGTLLRTHAALRRIATIQLLVGIGYGGFWATLALMLFQLHDLGPTHAGLMAIPGAAGILIARPAGRWMDRSGAAPVVTTGLLLLLAAYAAFAFAPLWLGAVIAGAMLLDLGVRAVIVANQTLANSIAPDARSRSNMIFSTSVWGGNGVGALLASTAFTYAGWLAVCAIGATFALLGLVVQYVSGRSGRGSRQPSS
ncbi:MAG: MFS transporter [Betaproteobacteria bacterium]|nr:MFS transporter [Betaproteobacteria bacterium]